MAVPQSQKEDFLKKIGYEAFAMVDDIYGRRMTRISLPPPTPTPPQPHHYPQTHYRLQHQYHYQQHYQHQSYDYQQQYCQKQSYLYQGNQVVTVREPVIDSNQAAKLYGGAVSVDYRRRKPARREAF